MQFVVNQDCSPNFLGQWQKLGICMHPLLNFLNNFIGETKTDDNEQLSIMDIFTLWCQLHVVTLILGRFSE